MSQKTQYIIGGVVAILWSGYDIVAGNDNNADGTTSAFTWFDFALIAGGF